MVLDYFTINDCGCASLGAGGSEDARVRLQWVRAERRNDRVSDGEWKPNMQVLEAAFNRLNNPWHPVAVHTAYSQVGSANLKKDIRRFNPAFLTAHLHELLQH